MPSPPSSHESAKRHASDHHRDDLDFDRRDRRSMRQRRRQDDYSFFATSPLRSTENALLTSIDHALCSTALTASPTGNGYHATKVPSPFVSGTAGVGVNKPPQYVRLAQDPSTISLQKSSAKEEGSPSSVIAVVGSPTISPQRDSGSDTGDLFFATLMGVVKSMSALESTLQEQAAPAVREAVVEGIEAHMKLGLWLTSRLEESRTEKDCDVAMYAGLSLFFTKSVCGG
ncbi:hypothetical protein ColLi_08269 [Colletotrichum liriopes]|uniref:Uncharacterized protein n=1 Tax=Colletotrichum liriopes TaxID=708192 RepID=A0AA37GS60_9PEZI|nr:hypothetical protein ColLi_08269 [Colletotrichum liriopes]